MLNQKRFVKNYLNAIKASPKTTKTTLSLVDTLINNDPYRLTEFEVSFKIKGDKISDYARLLHFDYNLYSCVNSYLYLKRLGLFESIIKSKLQGKFIINAFDSLRLVAETPLDLYFGFDTKDNEYLFAFWLILGGMHRNGMLSINPNSKKILTNVSKRLNIKIKIPKQKILNIGLDLGSKGFFLKLYYLYDKYLLFDTKLLTLIRAAQKRLSPYKHFIFVSDKLNSKSQIIFKKVYFEFLEDISPKNRELSEILHSILKIGGSEFDEYRLFSIIKKINGRISMVAFGSDSSITFYIRPC